MDILTRFRNVSSAGRRSVCIWLGVVVFAGLVLFPPWESVSTEGGISLSRGEAIMIGNRPLFKAPFPPAFAWRDQVDYIRLLMELAGSESFILALYLTWGRGTPQERTQTPGPLNPYRNRPEDSPTVEHRRATSNSSLIPKPPDVPVLEKLRQNLRLKTLYNEQLIDHLIQIERDRSPNASLQELMEAAIARWEWSSR